MPQKIILALGSNLGNRLVNIDLAISHLSVIVEGIQHSTILETEAWLLPNSPPAWDKAFLNMLISGTCNLAPRELLDTIKNIEQKLGRDMAAPRWAPRIIDIDILRYGDLHYSDDQLTIPHKDIGNRDFWICLLHEVTL